MNRKIVSFTYDTTLWELYLQDKVIAGRKYVVASTNRRFLLTTFVEALLTN